MKMLLVTAALAASIASAHAATTSVAPFVMLQKTIDGQTYEYNMALPRDQREVGVTITKNDSKGETQVMSAHAITLVATQKYNDHPKLFGLPFKVTQTSGYPVKLTVDGNDVPLPQEHKGVSAVVYLSDSPTKLGTASVHLKVSSLEKMYGGDGEQIDETVNFVLNEGVNVQTVGAYTLTVTVNPVQTSSTASL